MGTKKSESAKLSATSLAPAENSTRDSRAPAAKLRALMKELRDGVETLAFGLEHRADALDRLLQVQSMRRAPEVGRNDGMKGAAEDECGAAEREMEGGLDLVGRAATQIADLERERIFDQFDSGTDALAARRVIALAEITGATNWVQDQGFPSPLAELLLGRAVRLLALLEDVAKAERALQKWKSGARAPKLVLAAKSGRGGDNAKQHGEKKQVRP
jgi:hypothetical protein